MKQIVTIAAAVALCIALVGCGSSGSSSSAESSESSATAATSATASATSSASASSQSTPAVNWKDVTSPEEAAIGAGITKFGVMDSVKIGGNEFKDPKFSYTDGVAQATYETGAVALIVRKADGAHTVPLTDRTASEFANTWTKSYEGLDVTLYGEGKDAATVFEWADDTQEYGVTYQGLGGEEVTMTSNEVASIVKNIKAANVVGKKQESAESASKSASAASTQSQNANASGGEEVVWADEDELGYYDESEIGILGEDEAVSIAEQTSGGEYVDAEQVDTDEYGSVWQVTTEDENGNVSTYYVDENGDAYNISDVEEYEGDEGDEYVEETEETEETGDDENA